MEVKTETLSLVNLRAVKVDFGRDIVREVDFAAMPEEVLHRALYLGVMNMGKDSYAPIKKDEVGAKAKSESKVDQKLGAMYSGELRVNAGGERAPSDPVKAEAMKLAWPVVKAAIQKAGKLPKDKDAARETVKAAITDAILEKFMDRAREIVETRKALADEIDLGDLGL